ncbi:GNAT family N-acetyltransferase [bacterium]|nr:GNAT family N-acetyltransferase [bacterium]
MNEIDCDIRKMKPEDFDKLYPLVQEFASSFTVSFESFKNSFESLMKDENALLLVAETESGIIGYCLGFLHYTFYANGKVACLEEIMVKASYQRHGFGRELLSHFETWARIEGAILNTLATRRAASFYYAVGYEESAAYFRKML